MAALASSSLVPAALMPLASGISARTVAVSLSAPLENVRTLMYAGARAGTAPPSALAIVRSQLREGGLARLWRGAVPYAVRDIPFSAVYWTVLENSRGAVLERLQALAGRPATPPTWAAAAAEARGRGGHAGRWEGSTNASTNPDVAAGTLVASNFVSGLLAGGVAAVVTHPSDVVYVRRVAGGCGGTGLAVARLTLRQEGPAGFYRGALPRVAKIAPSCACVIASYELFKRVLWEQGSEQCSEQD